MKCSRSYCNNEISNRKTTARYCSNDCYYEQKKERSNKRYHSIKAPSDEITRCEGILKFLYSVYLLGKEINASDLQAYKFNFSIATGEYIDKEKGLCKIVGSYCYHLNKDKTVTIWKLKLAR